MDIISAVLQKHFGFSSLKAFQKEVLDAWFAHEDCVLLAAIGSGGTKGNEQNIAYSLRCCRIT
uniref:Uncharacterized protein n=1 Tax=Zea mays TaxID=4577 RepID=A0A804UB74_MAIZE